MQLAVQADIIAGLTQQRNFLLEEKAEEQQRWEAEREGWERMAEALIGKRKAAADASSLDDVSVLLTLWFGLLDRIVTMKFYSA